MKISSPAILANAIACLFAEQAFADDGEQVLHCVPFATCIGDYGCVPSQTSNITLNVSGDRSQVSIERGDRDLEFVRDDTETAIAPDTISFIGSGQALGSYIHSRKWPSGVEVIMLANTQFNPVGGDVLVNNYTCSQQEALLQ